MNKKQIFGYALALTSSVFLSACGSSNGTTSGLNGELELAITDAEEDFLSYQIELDSIALKKANGTSVEVMPLSTEIDFVQYQELTELFAVLSVPAGEYTSIQLELDYSNADIVIQDEDGNSYQASVQDSDGHSISELNVELSLNDGESIYISPFKTAQLTLDLDLAASNTIESFSPPLVTVEPFMIGSTSLDEEREHRIRGLLEEVNLEEAQITLELIPMRFRSGRFGDFTFAVDDTTLYEINGEEFTGQNGLNALAEMPSDTPIVGYGSPSTEQGVRYIATQVQAGSSVPWAEQDILKGTITARTDNTLTIAGAVIEPSDEGAHFKRTIELSVSDDTVVTGYRLGDATEENLSVGQRILALGNYDTVNDQFDSTDGHVRMKLSRIVGEVTQVSPLALDLTHINRRPSEVFDFAGTGADASNDADPDNYQVETGALTLNEIEMDEWVQVRGYPTAFGSAPMDFDALSIINPDFNSHPARFFGHWQEPATDALTVSQGNIEVNADNARMKLHLKGVPGSSQLELSLSSITSTAPTGKFALLERGKGIHIYRDFDSFTTALNEHIQNGLAVHHVTASGQYTANTESMHADYVTIRLTHIEEATEQEPVID